MSTTAEIIEREVDAAYPDRAPSVHAKIVERISLIWAANDLDLSRDMLRTLAKIDPALVRETPTIASALAFFEEKHAKTFGVPMTPAQRIAKQRELEKLTPDERVALVPASIKNAAPAPVTLVTKTPEEDLDAEVERRFGLAPGSAKALSALDRIRYHAALKKESKTAAAPTAPVDATRTDIDSTLERMNAARRAAAAK